MLADLAEEPGIANDAAADHQAGGAGLREHFLGFRGGVDVAVGEDGARHRGDGALHEFVTRRAAIHFLHRAGVDGEEVEIVAREDGEEFVEDVRVVETDARFDGEGNLHRGAQGAENLVDAFRIAQQTAAGAFFVNDRDRAAEI